MLDIVNWHAASLPAQTLDLAELLARTRERTRLVVWINDITVDSARILFPAREWHVRPSAQLLGLWTNPELTFDRDAAMKTFQQIAALAPNKPDCLIVYSCTPHPTTRCPLAANRDWDRFNATGFVQSGYALSVVRDESDLLARLNLPPKTRIDRQATQILDQVAQAESAVYDQLCERARAIELGSRPMPQIQSDPSAWIATYNRSLANIAEIRLINRPDLLVYAFSREEIRDLYQLDSNDPALLDKLELVVLQRRQHWESKLHRLNTGQ
ncbi:MAG: hypothetical protein IBJ18_10370 [Phycisphaerales bacterium]|nr:hypothetical protein [Phycisphaerales bacterium]